MFRATLYSEVSYISIKYYRVGTNEYTHRNPLLKITARNTYSNSYAHYILETIELEWMKKQKASLCLQNHQSPPLHGAYIAGIVLHTLHVVTDTLIVTDPMI